MIERQRYILDFTISSLLRQKGKNGGLLLVYTALVFVVASILFFSHALRREAELLLKEAPEIVVQRTLAGRQQPVPAAWLKRVGEIDGVTSLRPRLWGYHYDPQLRATYTLLVPTESAPPKGCIDIGAGVSRIRGASGGDIMVLPGHDGMPRSYKVRQVLSPESQLLTADLVLLCESDYRDFSGLAPDRVTDLAVTVANPKETPTVAEKIARLYPDSRPIQRSELQRTYDAAFSWRSGLLLVIFSGAALAFAIFAWDKATGLCAEQRKEIGILKAVGWETSDVMLMKFWEGGVISLTAFLLGVVLAYAHVFLAPAPLFAPVLKGWSTLYPAFRLTPYLDFGELLTLFFLTVVPYAAATLIPSWRAAVTDPDLVLR